MKALSIAMTQQDVAALTGKQRPSAQRRALDAMGIPYIARPDGIPVVLRENILRQRESTREPELRI